MCKSTKQDGAKTPSCCVGFEKDTTLGFYLSVHNRLKLYSLDQRSIMQNALIWRSEISIAE